MKFALRALCLMATVALVVVIGCGEDNEKVADIKGVAAPAGGSGLTTPKTQSEMYNMQKNMGKNMYQTGKTGYPGAGTGPAARP